MAAAAEGGEGSTGRRQPLMGQEELLAIIERIAAGEHSEIDVEILREALYSEDKRALLQLGKYNINIGQGGEEVHIGDRTFVDINEEVVKAIVAAIMAATYSRALGRKYLDLVLSVKTTVSAVLFAGVIGCIRILAGSSGLADWIVFFSGISTFFIICLYYCRLWAPERRKTSLPSDRCLSIQERIQVHRKEEKKRKLIRRLSQIGLILTPIIIIGVLFAWHYEQNILSKDIIVLVAEFNGPDKDKYVVTENILAQLKEATAQYPDVKIEALSGVITEQEGSEVARARALERNASIMIWGWYAKTDAAVQISANFEVIKPSPNLLESGDIVGDRENTYAISELDEFQLQTQLSSELSYLTLFATGVTQYTAGNWREAIKRFDSALQQVSEQPDTLNQEVVFSLKGSAHASAQEYEQALTAYNRALDIEPFDQSTLINKGVVLADLDRFAEAISLYDMTLAVYPNLYHVYNNKGSALDHLEEHEKAIELYEIALSKEPGEHAALIYNNIGIALEALDRDEGAIDAYDKALDIRPIYGEAYYNKGVALGKLNRRAEAIEAYTAALEINPDNYRALSNRCGALAELGAYRKAIEDCDVALELQPDLPGSIINKGLALTLAGNYREAMNFYDLALQREPDNSEFISRRGFALAGVVEDKHEAILRAVSTAVDVDPDNLEIIYRKALVFSMLGEYEEALSTYDTYLGLKPDSIKGVVGKGDTLAGLERYQQALDLYAVALEWQPNAPDTLSSLGNTLWRMERYPEALEAFDLALKTDPAFQKAIYGRGITLDELGQYEAAIKAYDSVLELYPDDYRALFNKGFSLAALGRYRAAIDDFEAVLKITPDDFWSYFQIARCYTRMGKNRAALKTLEKLMRLSPEKAREEINSSEEFDSLRSESRFQRLIENN